MEELSPIEEIGILGSYRAIIDQISVCTDVEKRNIFAWGFRQITQQVQYPKVGVAIRAMIDDVIESPEDTDALLPVLRQVIELAFADAEKRFQEEERLADEKYGSSAA